MSADSALGHLFLPRIFHLFHHSHLSGCVVGNRGFVVSHDLHLARIFLGFAEYELNRTGHTSYRISKENAKSDTPIFLLDFKHLGEIQCQAMQIWGRKYLLNRNLIPLNGRTLHRLRNGNLFLDTPIP